MASTRLVRPAFALAAGLTLLAGCATGRSAAEVTRFHLNQPIARGTIAVQPAHAAAGQSLEFRTYSAAVAQALRGAGFTPLDNPLQAEFVAVVDVGQTTRASLDRGSGVSIGIGGGTFGRNVGIGGGITLPVGGRKPSEVAVNMLSLQIKRRADSNVVWEGRAVSEARAGTATANPGAAVPKLAEALLQGFPGPSGQTVRVNL